MKIKKILVSQPKPCSERSPYFDLAEKLNLQIDFRSFIYVEGITGKEFRTQKINILDYTAVILTSKNAADHFFRMAEEMRVCIPDSMKYFCITESVALYLQKYIVYRKRKIFFGKSKLEDLMEVIINKHKGEKFLVSLSDKYKKEIPEVLEQYELDYKIAILYKTVSSDLSDLSNVNYDVLVFFSPSGIMSLLKNFPDFEQNSTKIASFGDSTARAVKNAGLRLDIQVPQPQVPSMTMALEQYIKNHNNSK